MPDKPTPKAPNAPQKPLTGHFDLVVIGAGIAGLNALHAASLFLPASARILLIDLKDRPGGMWTMAYDYVRLHQPHPLFTVASTPWNWHKPRGYLATRDEVQQHLAGCLDALLGKLDAQTRFGHRACGVREVQQAGAWMAEVDVHPVGDPNTLQTVTADRVIHADGFDYQAPVALELSAPGVLSIPPAGLRKTLAENPHAPVYVAGGGKTGMDTVLAVLADDPKRAVTVINGRGTYFLNRTKFFPTGIRRWIGGLLAADIFRDCAMRFDGRNADEVCGHFIATYAVNPDPRSTNFIYGIMSEAENAQIETGLQDKIWDYLDDVEDGPSGPVMRLRSGTEMPVEVGSIVVNCTGSLFRSDKCENPAPCLSPHDVILSINTHDAMHVLTTYSSFILSHLFLSGRLRTSGLYFLDLAALLKTDKHAFSAATMVQSYHNLLMGIKNLPASSRKHFGMDFNLWYPLPRRMLALNRIRKTGRADIQHCRKSLDAVVQRFGIRGGKIE